jgi:hypothetical protein
METVRRRRIARGVLTSCLLLWGWSAWAKSDTWKADNGNGTYSNPLFFDEFSDCDLIRVGWDFYLTGTMHSMPGLPIPHSRDVVNWQFVSYALDRLDLGPAFRPRTARISRLAERVRVTRRPSARLERDTRADRARRGLGFEQRIDAHRAGEIL